MESPGKGRRTMARTLAHILIHVVFPDETTTPGPPIGFP